MCVCVCVCVCVSASQGGQNHLNTAHHVSLSFDPHLMFVHITGTYTGPAVASESHSSILYFIKILPTTSSTLLDSQQQEAASALWWG